MIASQTIFCLEPTCNNYLGQFQCDTCSVRYFCGKCKRITIILQRNQEIRRLAIFDTRVDIAALARKTQPFQINARETLQIEIPSLLTETEMDQLWALAK